MHPKTSQKKKKAYILSTVIALAAIIGSVASVHALSIKSRAPGRITGNVITIYPNPGNCPSGVPKRAAWTILVSSSAQTPTFTSSDVSYKIVGKQIIIWKKLPRGTKSMSGTAKIDGGDYTLVINSHRCLPRTYYYKGRRYYTTTCKTRRGRKASCPQKCLDEIDAVRARLRKLRLKHGDDNTKITILVKALEAQLKALEDRLKAAETANGQDETKDRRFKTELDALKKKVAELEEAIKKKAEEKKTKSGMKKEVLVGGLVIPVGSGHVGGGFGLKFNVLWPTTKTLWLGLNIQLGGNFRDYDILRIPYDDVLMPVQNWSGGGGFALNWMPSRYFGIFFEVNLVGVVEYGPGRLTGEIDGVLHGVERRLSGFIAAEAAIGIKINAKGFLIAFGIGWRQPFMPRLENACGLAGCGAEENYMGDLMLGLWFGWGIN
jgi:hypothetical protein